MRLLLLSLISFPLLFASCTPKTAAVVDDPTQTVVPFDAKTTLLPGQTMRVLDREGSLKFVEVMSDSRCPKGVSCIQAGEAQVVVELPDGGRQILVIGANQRQPERVATGTIVLNVTGLYPYPQEGSRIGQEDYRLQVIAAPLGE